ncbi:MAG TPA: YbjN domain-containing protein [Candidatus Limnocylindrales bacterium]|nr:YbjN domain-containing protein [Candidatus Limnocylindrales bacterium]
MSIAPSAGRAALRPAEVEAWLTELRIEPVERAEREGVTSWDLVLDGRRRFDLRITLILDPSLALIGWAHYAPPISDSFRRSYRRLLRWNDELPFAKFAIADDERPILAVELPVDQLDADALGVALARVLAIADGLLDETAGWLKAAGWTYEAAGRSSRGAHLIDRYADRLGELGSPDVATEAGA